MSLALHRAESPVVSPDGKWLAFILDESRGAAEYGSKLSTARAMKLVPSHPRTSMYLKCHSVLMTHLSSLPWPATEPLVCLPLGFPERSRSLLSITPAIPQCRPTDTGSLIAG